ncbi:MAG: T9SS type A sorting domain-containing protein [Saprospiraceae bacterium]
MNLAYPSLNNALTKMISFVFSFLFIICLPSKSICFNQENISNAYYLNKEWVPTYVSKQYSGLVCISEVQISLDQAGKMQLKASMLLVPPVVSDLNYNVQVVGKYTDSVSCKDVGYKLKVMVTEIATSNSCWSFVLIEDKLKPAVLCRDTTVLCTGTLAGLDSIPGLVFISDNCTPFQNLHISHSDNSMNLLDCSNDTISMVSRNWTAIDLWGRVGSCTQKISLLKPHFSDITFPKDTILYCPVSNTSPSDVGQPLIQGKPLDKFCGWLVKYEDVVYNKCGITKKIIRTWNILNCCSIKDTTVNQFIVISDTARPVITCRATDSVSTSPQLCEAKYLLKPVLSAIDACHGTGLTTLIQIDHAFYGIPNTKIILSIGTHWLTYEVSDPCGNKSMCSSSVVVQDKQRPVLLCPDTIQISIPSIQVRLAATTFKSVSAFDNCGINDLKIRRTIDNCIDGIDDTYFKDTISVCCSDVFKSFDFVFSVHDIYGNQDSCHVKVNVVDKSAPQLNCAQTETILCNQAIPAWIDPRLSLVDNCADSVKIKIDTLDNSFNLCGLGQIKRRISAIDPGNNKDTCFQTITIVNQDTLRSAQINLQPSTDTIKIFDCADSLRNKIGEVGYKPPTVTIPPLGCHKIFINFTDTAQNVAGTSRCKIIKRTWRVGDTCYSLSAIKNLIQIIIQDTSAFSPLQGPMTGKVLSITGVPIEDVHIEGKNQQQALVYSQMTDRNGSFEFDDQQHLVSLAVNKTEPNILNGISTLDLLRIQHHISGTKVLDNALDVYAADIDGNGDINVLDLVKLRKLILGFEEETNILPWLFTKPLPDMSHIKLGSKIPSVYALSPESDLENFVGFRIGDVNHDAIFNSLLGLQERSAIIPWTLNIDPKTTSITAVDQSPFLGFQLSLVNANGWKGLSIESPFAGIQYHVINKELRINWSGKQPMQLNKGISIVSLSGPNMDDIRQGSLKSEWYGQRYDPHSIEFIYASLGISMSLYPNPTPDVLHVKISKPISNGYWNILDETGRIILRGVLNGTESKIILGIQSLPTGIYLFQLVQANAMITRKRFVKTE